MQCNGITVGIAVGIVHDKIGELGLAIGIVGEGYILYAVVSQQNAVGGVHIVAQLNSQLRIGAGGGDAPAGVIYGRVMELGGIDLAALLLGYGSDCPNQEVGVIAVLGIGSHGANLVVVQGNLTVADHIGAVKHNLVGIVVVISVDQALGIPLCHELQVIPIALLQGAELNGAVFHIEGAADAEAAGNEIVHTGNRQNKGGICALLGLESSQYVMELVIGLGHIQAQIVQPVLADEVALVAAAAVLLVVIQAVEGHQVALGGGNLVEGGGIGVDDSGVVGHQILIVQKVHENFLVQGGIGACVVQGRCAVHNAGEIAGCGHQVELIHLGKEVGHLEVDANAGAGLELGIGLVGVGQILYLGYGTGSCHPHIKGGGAVGQGQLGGLHVLYNVGNGQILAIGTGGSCCGLSRAFLGRASGRGGLLLCRSGGSCLRSCTSGRRSAGCCTAAVSAASSHGTYHSNRQQHGYDFLLHVLLSSYFKIQNLWPSLLPRSRCTWHRSWRRDRFQYTVRPHRRGA